MPRWTSLDLPGQRRPRSVLAGKAAGIFGFGIVLSVLPDLLPEASGVPELWMVGAFLAPLVLMAVSRHPLAHGVAHVVSWLMLLLQMLFQLL